MPECNAHAPQNVPVDVRDASQALIETVWRLRQPDGCPWDREQTHESIAKNLIEEAYEALDCIEQGDIEHLREELGDVLMQVVLQSQIAHDQQEFTCADIMCELNEKLIRRHPHVFGDVQAATGEEALKSWEQVKLAEKAQAAEKGLHKSLLDDVPRSLPALMQAQKVSRKAASVGFEWETIEDIWAQVDEERSEFLAEEPKTEARAREFGNLLFALVNIARREGIDAESALRASTSKFRARWAHIEAHAEARHCGVEELSTAEMNEIWEQAKRFEAEG
ncbi:nucleoside triphosphate pyrophosphohydrolase [Collinsella sp. zg1085]|uniref:nucleoside triphosphate pyrophosphohydrolase n=1 Tax=Collinsella sp. zg1085 TaxID=2844380 RepID=UPI001C0CF45B|nr:nucleoside triphosphate pyrophosphohydrolase [Collinsella sp. zg1085]QWT17762.1 nucleoside triphosphate pyrophosphohydrolase [Collinsella sp. zg1085]